MQPLTFFIGFDSREPDGFAVTRDTLRAWINGPKLITGLVLADLVARGLYTRPTEISHVPITLPFDVPIPDALPKRRKLVDVLSKRADYDGEISTEFAISRFLVPALAKQQRRRESPGHMGWACFMDSDMLIRRPMGGLMRLCADSPDKAVLCVQHDYAPKDAIKMDGVRQTTYFRKNWSSFVLFNLDHPANRELSIEMVNALPGRDLHRFCWLDDSEIGALDAGWNYLVGHTRDVENPTVVHFTTGLPTMPGHENDEFAGEWFAARDRWAA